ncbi:hypothetical protein [Leuconostoc gasicomitatum]|uniref:hypothetical protein n=1 Tax=Leuconostoc gasicomitatum TaxID=115778 RepID=UPI0007DEC517|nr:hypothetical protein [Leuconostoc gasicomitatum]CUW06037.1 FIG00773959: hypothetical protein [Leuconostoc gasicomitatum]
MQNAIEMKIMHIKKMVKKLNYLQKKNAQVLPDSISVEDRDEIQLLERMLEDMNVSDDIFQKQPKTINIKNNRDEEWYFQQMKTWIQRRPTALNGQSGRSTIYKFALHFFVENIVLQPDNTQLSELLLAERIKNLHKQTPKNVADFKLEKLEEMTSFTMAMIFKQYDYIPEEVLNDKMINYAINSMNEYGFSNSIKASDINPNDQLGKTFKLYRELRQRDKQLIKKLNNKSGGGIQND